MHAYANMSRENMFVKMRNVCENGVRKQGGGETPPNFAQRVYIAYRKYIGCSDVSN
jgi:hypothetical protein